MAAEERTWTCPSEVCGHKQAKALGNRIKASAAGHLLFVHGIVRERLIGEIEDWDLSSLSEGVHTPDETAAAAPGGAAAVDSAEEATAAGPDDLSGRVGALETAVAAQGSAHGLCTDPRCLICRQDKVTLAQDGMQVGRFAFQQEIDEAATRYGLEPQRDLLAQAVDRLRAEKGESGDAKADPDLVRVTG